MPCKECESGKWKWGNTGECQYETLADCEEANAEYYLEERIPKLDLEVEEQDIDHSFNFTPEQMEELHTNGELIVTIEEEKEDGEKVTMIILFTYNIEDVDDEEIEEMEEEYNALTSSLLDDELDEYVDRLTDSLKKL